jgi:hypothetical protein
MKQTENRFLAERRRLAVLNVFPFSVSLLVVTSVAQTRQTKQLFYV